MSQSSVKNTSIKKIIEILTFINLFLTLPALSTRFFCKVQSFDVGLQIGCKKIQGQLPDKIVEKY
jgi:hypothetical protein